MNLFLETKASGPTLHDLKDVTIRWNADGSILIYFPTGTGPITVHEKRMGNYRRAGFSVRRRQL